MLRGSTKRVCTAVSALGGLSQCRRRVNRVISGMRLPLPLLPHEPTFCCITISVAPGQKATSPACDAFRGLYRQSPAFAYPEARSSTSGSTNGVWLLTCLPIITLPRPGKIHLPPFDRRQRVHDSPVLAQEGRVSLFRSDKQFPLFVGYGRDFLLRNIGRQVRRIVERRRPALMFFDHAPMDALVDVLLGRIVAVL